LPHEIHLEKDVEYVDGKIKAGEYKCLYEEGDFCFVEVGGYIIGLHRSLINTSKRFKRVVEDVGGN
jgi:hypothetical protein